MSRNYQPGVAGEMAIDLEERRRRLRDLRARQGDAVADGATPTTGPSMLPQPGPVPTPTSTTAPNPDAPTDDDDGGVNTGLDALDGTEEEPGIDDLRGAALTRALQVLMEGPLLDDQALADIDADARDRAARQSGNLQARLGAGGFGVSGGGGALQAGLEQSLARQGRDEGRMAAERARTEQLNRILAAAGLSQGERRLDITETQAGNLEALIQNILGVDAGDSGGPEGVYGGKDPASPEGISEAVGNLMNQSAPLESESALEAIVSNSDPSVGIGTRAPGDIEDIGSVHPDVIGRLTPRSVWVNGQLVDVMYDPVTKRIYR